MKHLFFFFLVLVAVSQSGIAQILYTDIEPDSIVAGVEDSYFIDLNKDGTFDFEVRNFQPGGNYGKAVEFYTGFIGSSYSGEVLMTSSYPLALNINEIIQESSDSAEWKNGMGFLNDDGISGKWLGVEDKYLALRLKVNQQYFYGWARLDIPLDASLFTIKDFALNQTADESILAGQKLVDGITEFENNNSIKAFPNPFNTFLTFSIPNNIIINDLKLFNIYGEQLIPKIEIYNNKILLFKGNLTNGIYFFELLNGNKIINKGKIIITD